MNRETLNTAYAEIDSFRDKLGEVLVDAVTEDCPGLDIAKAVISTFYSCQTKSDYEIANDMLAAVCGGNFKTLVQMVKKRDAADDFEWETVDKENT